MKIMTLITETDGYQVKMVSKENEVAISVLTIDQRQILYNEKRIFQNDKIAQDYSNEFTKRQAREIVKRYLRYEKG